MNVHRIERPCPDSLNPRTIQRLASPLLAVGLLFAAVFGNAEIIVKVDSTQPWQGWVNVSELNGTYVSSYPWSFFELPAQFIPSENPSGWPLHTHLVLKPNIRSYNVSDPFWNLPDGAPNKILEANCYVDVFTQFTGETVTFQGYVVSNSIPRLSGGPATGWQVVAFVKELTPSYDFIGMAAVLLDPHKSFSVSRAIGVGHVCQYGFYVKGPNTTPGSASALTGVGIVVEDTSAQAVLPFTFDAGAQNFRNFTWSQTSPAGWWGGAAVQARPSVGGWTLGNGFNYHHEFDFVSGEQPRMQQLAATGNGLLSFDVFVDGRSFLPSAASWYTLNVAGNSGGAKKWTVIEKVSGDAWHNAYDDTLYATHVDLTFAQLGWNDAFDRTGWFQMYFGANSAADFPVRFYIDNVTVSELTSACVIPEETDPFVVRTIAVQTGGAIWLSWASCSSHLYEVQTSEDPSASSSWTPRALVIGLEGVTSWATPASSAGDPRRFYRVQRLDFAGDQDGDGLSNLAEFKSATGLHNPDTDGDGMPDGWESRYGLNPLDPADEHADFDGDGYSNAQEYQWRTRPNASYQHPAGPPGGLVAWWKLDEGSGTNVFDASFNGHHGYVLGGNPAGTWTTGYLSNAVTLGGPSANCIEVPYQASLSSPQELTLMGWVKPLGQGMLIGNWDSPGQLHGNYQLHYGPEQVELRFSPAGDGSYSTLQFNPNWSTNQWHHLAVTYRDVTNVNVFVDGEWRGRQIVTGPFLPVTNPILIGFPGVTDASSVDDVRIYDRALDTNEMASLSRGNGLPLNLIVGQTASLRAFGASEGDACQWSIIAGQGLLTKTAGLTTDFTPSWSGAVTVQVVVASAGLLQTNLSPATVTFPGLSPIANWNEPNVQPFNNCYSFATDIRTDTMAQTGGPPYYYAYTCDFQTSAAISDGLQAAVDLADLPHTSGLPNGHVVALLVWPNWDFHWVRMEANGMWSSKAGNSPATTLDNSGRLIVDPRTASFPPYQFCGFFWVGPDVNILHFPL